METRGANSGRTSSVSPALLTTRWWCSSDSPKLSTAPRQTHTQMPTPAVHAVCDVGGRGAARSAGMRLIAQRECGGQGKGRTRAAARRARQAEGCPAPGGSGCARTPTRSPDLRTPRPDLTRRPGGTLPSPSPIAARAVRSGGAGVGGHAGRCTGTLSAPPRPQSTGALGLPAPARSPAWSAARARVRACS